MSAKDSLWETAEDVASARSSFSGRLKDRILGWRDRLLMSEGFHRTVAKIPILRGIGNRHSKQLLDLATGFVHTQVLYACLASGLLDALREGPLTMTLASRLTRWPPDSSERLVRAAISLNLLSWRDPAQVADRRFGLSVLGAALLGAPGVRQMMEHNQLLYRDLADPLALLAERPSDTALSAYWPYAVKSGEDVRLSPDAASAYSVLMARSQLFVADDVAALVDLRASRQLVDIGGGDGTFLRRIGLRYPALKLSLFDLPDVASLARQRFAEAALPNPVSIHPGSFRDDPLPDGADTMALIRVCHDHDDDVVIALLRRIHAALIPGGRLIIAEPMAETPGAESFADAYFGFYFLAMGTGRARSPKRIKDLLLQAGFVDIVIKPSRRPIVATVIIATKRGTLGVNTK